MEIIENDIEHIYNTKKNIDNFYNTLYEFINYKEKEIHKDAVNKIKNSEFYNNTAVQDKLSDVEGLEIEYVRFPEISLDSKDGKTKNKVYMVMRKTGKK